MLACNLNFCRKEKGGCGTSFFGLFVCYWSLNAYRYDPGSEISKCHHFALWIHPAEQCFAVTLVELAWGYWMLTIRSEDFKNQKWGKEQGGKAGTELFLQKANCRRIKWRHLRLPPPRNYLNGTALCSCQIPGICKWTSDICLITIYLRKETTLPNLSCLLKLSFVVTPLFDLNNFSLTLPLNYTSWSC